MSRRRNPRNPQTETPTSSAAFRRWFGDSKVVDAEGNPLVVYHGSQQVDIEVFQTARHFPAFYFTNDDELASGYGEEVYSVYLRMERPLVVDAGGADWTAIPPTAVKMRGWSAEDKKTARGFMANGASTDVISELAYTLGFDGAIIRNVVDAAADHDYEVMTTVYVVFSPKQIKSARENAGTFDPDDASIYRNPRRNGRGGTAADRTDPDLWEAVKREVTSGSKGGKPGQWSARKAQLAVALYRQRGGGYWGPKDPRNSLAKWTREKWRTKSGRPSLKTGERYLPSKAIAALTDAEYAATTRAKRAGMRKGQQFVPQPEAVALKVRAYRRNPTPPESLVEYYSYGRCMWLALALHQRYGWPITADVEVLPSGERYVSHAWVTMPDGREVDILGPQTMVDRFGGREMRVSPREMLNTVGETSNTTPAEVAAEVAAANEVIDRYLLPELGKANPARRAGEKAQPEDVALKVRAYRRNPAMRIVAYLEMYGDWYSATESQWAALVAAGIAGKGWNLDRLTTPLKRRPSSVSANGDSFLPVVRPLDFYEPEEWEEVDAQVRRMQAALARAYRKNTRRRNPHQQGHGIDPRLLAADGARYFSDEALAEADQEAGSSKSRTALVLMRPRDFLAMAEPGMREESQAALERVLDAGVRLSDVPRLFIATSRTDPHRAVVTGHEGRHRSRALLARGVTQMPVRIHSQDIRWGEQTDPESWDYDPVLPSVLVGEGANKHNTLPMPVPLHYPELAPRLRPRTNPRRRNPVQNIEDGNMRLKGTYGTAEDVFFGLVQQQFDANMDIFLEQPEGTPERTLRTVARRRLRTLGINPKARAYAIDFLNLTVRGKGSGSRIVGEIEKTLRDEGEQVVFLIAARLFADAPHSRGFWKRMGYTEISGNYEPLVWEFGNEVEDDRIMFKVL